MSEDLSEYLEQDIIGLILQYLYEKNYTEAAHKLEKESQYYFDIEHFKQLWIDGDWDSLVSYLSGFIKPDQNSDHNYLLYFEIIKQKFLDALDRGDKTVASTILKNEIRSFLNLSEGDMDPESRRVQIYNEFASLLTFDDFRKHKNLTWVENASETRKAIFPKIEAYLLEKVPAIQQRCEYPDIPFKGRLRTIINQSLNWQMSLIPHDSAVQPRIQTLFVDHNCFTNDPVGYGNYAFTLKKRAVQQQQTTKDDSEDEGSDSEDKHVSAKRPRSNSTATPNVRRPKRQRLSRGREELRNSFDDEAEIDYEVPTEIAFVLQPLEDAVPAHVAFHPKDEGLLLVAAKNGTLILWDIIKKEVKAKLTTTDSVQRLIWSPCGKYFVVIHERVNVLPVYELKAKDGNDLPNAPRILLLKTLTDHAKRITTADWAYIPTQVNAESERLVLITGSEAGSIKAYDIADNQALRWSFEGNQVPVNTLCVIQYRHVPVLLSTGADGTIRVWLFTDPEKSPTPGMAVVEESTSIPSKPVHAMMSGESRVFSCGTEEGSLMEWNYVQGKELRKYPYYLYDTNVSLFVSLKYKTIATNSGSKLRFWHINKGTPRAELNLPAKAPSFDLNSTTGVLAVVVETGGGAEIQIYANSTALAIWPPQARISTPKPRPAPEIKTEPIRKQSLSSSTPFPTGAGLTPTTPSKKLTSNMVEVTPINVPTPSAIPVHGSHVSTTGSPVPAHGGQLAGSGGSVAQSQGMAPISFSKPQPGTSTTAPPGIQGPSTWPPGLPPTSYAVSRPMSGLPPPLTSGLLSTMVMAPPSMTVPTLTPTPTALAASTHGPSPATSTTTTTTSTSHGTSSHTASTGAGQNTQANTSSSGSHMHVSAGAAHSTPTAHATSNSNSAVPYVDSMHLDG